MKYWLFDVRWSQTDMEKVIISAKTREEAISIAKSKFRGAAYADCIGLVREVR